MNKNNSLESILKDTKDLAVFLEDKKALDVLALDVSKQAVFADAFVIISGMSFTHIQSLQSSVSEFLEKKNYQKRNPRNVLSENPWILLDFGDIIVHLFTQEAREFYDLRKLWFDATVLYPK